MPELDRRKFLRLLGGASASLPLACGAGDSGSDAAPRPNIILIMADDLGFSDIGCYGGEIETPNLDRLAQGGVRLTQFYNAARCCPTRASLMTGLYQHQAGVGHMMEDYALPGYRGDLSPSCVTIAEVLRSAGYTTLMSGKWHVTTPDPSAKHNWPRQRGFDRFYGTIHGAGSFYDPVSLTRENEAIEPERDDYYYTTAIGDEAVAYIDEYGRASSGAFGETSGENAKPFFLYTAFTAPHWPLHAPDDAIKKYKGRYDQGWDALRDERRRRMIDMGLIDEAWPLTPRDESVPAWEDADNKEWHARRMEVYAAQVDLMDQAIGKIVAKVEQMGLSENTLILFLADNGGCAEEIQPQWTGLHYPSHTRDGRPVQQDNDPAVMPGPEETYQSYGVPWANASNTPFRLYKHWVHEGGIASPLIAYQPGAVKQTGQLNSEPSHLIDIMATCVDVSGAEYPAEYRGHAITPLEGKSLAPVFASGERESHEAIFWEHEGNRAIRQGKWKLVSRYNEQERRDGPWELYDIDADRTEMNNLAAEQPERVTAMAGVWEAWAARSLVVPWRSWEKPEQA